jgi:hypothetical protein
MKRKPKNRRGRPAKILRLWTHIDAEKALPYVRSIMGSLREHWLDVHRAKQHQRRLDRKSGRPSRAALLEREGATQDSDSAVDRFDESLGELMALDIYCVDPVEGLALIPFRKGEELAWFVFDLFLPERLETWRLHNDPMEMRRPLAEAFPDGPQKRPA